MKNNNLFQLLLTICFFMLFKSTHAQTASDVNFTDVDGITHNLYTYLDSGYTVFLDFADEYCIPCKDWATTVGHALWSDRGPDGDNTVRMFHFDTRMNRTDQEVIDYANEWGVEYPLINLTNGLGFDGYPVESFQIVYAICPSREYILTGGEFPHSAMDTLFLLAVCEGNDLSNNKGVVPIDLPNPSTICHSTPLSFSPKIHVYNSESSLSDSSGFFFMEEYPVQVLINGVYHSTQNIDPWSDGNVNNVDDVAYLEPFPVNPGDEVALVIDFEGDNYPNDDTSKIIIPTSINTPISSDTVLSLTSSGNDIYYYIFNSAGEIIREASGSGQFSLDADSCYSISFINGHIYSATLKDLAGNTLVSYEAGDFLGFETPRLYFHVGTEPVDVIEQKLADEQLLKHYFLDLLGKCYNSNQWHDLPQGIYIDVKHYQNGQVRTEKVYQMLKQ